MTPREPAADLDEALEEIELLVPAVVLFGLAPLAAIGATTRPSSPFFVDLAVLVARLAELLPISIWIW